MLRISLKDDRAKASALKVIDTQKIGSNYQDAKTSIFQPHDRSAEPLEVDRMAQTGGMRDSSNGETIRV